MSGFSFNNSYDDQGNETLESRERRRRDRYIDTTRHPVFNIYRQWNRNTRALGPYSYTRRPYQPNRQQYGYSLSQRRRVGRSEYSVADVYTPGYFAWNGRPLSSRTYHSYNRGTYIPLQESIHPSHSDFRGGIINYNSAVADQHRERARRRAAAIAELEREFPGAVGIGNPNSHRRAG